MEKKTEAGPGAGQKREPAAPGPQSEGSKERAQGSEVSSRPDPLRRPRSTPASARRCAGVHGALVIVAIERAK